MSAGDGDKERKIRTGASGERKRQGVGHRRRPRLVGFDVALFPARSNASLLTSTRGSRPELYDVAPVGGWAGLVAGGPFSPQLGAHAPSFMMSPPLGG